MNETFGVCFLRGWSRTTINLVRPEQQPVGLQSSEMLHELVGLTSDLPTGGDESKHQLDIVELRLFRVVATHDWEVLDSIWNILTLKQSFYIPRNAVCSLSSTNGTSRTFCSSLFCSRLLIYLPFFCPSFSSNFGRHICLFLSIHYIRYIY